MAAFIDGEEIEYTFTTSKGAVDTLAVVHIEGSTLELRDVLVYPHHGDRLDVGLKDVLAIARLIQDLAMLRASIECSLQRRGLQGPRREERYGWIGGWNDQNAA